MYKHWDDQKKQLLELIYGGKSASCQVCIGTNYPIFFRNMHSDLLLKKSIIPVYIDVSYIQNKTPYNLYKSMLLSIKRTLLEKKLSNKVEMLETNIEDIHNAINTSVIELASKNFVIAFFFEDFDLMGEHTKEILLKNESIKASNEKCSFIYLTKTNVFHPENVSQFSRSPHIYENILYFPSKDEKYLKSIEKGVSPKIFKIIYELTGGVDSFFSIAMDLKNNLSPRERKNIDKYIHDNLHLKKEVAKMWDSFSESEIKLLSQIVWGVKEVDKELEHDLKHLISLGVLTEIKGTYKISVGLLRSVGVEKSMKRQVAVDFENEKVKINGHEVAMKLSEAERRILRQLLMNKNKIIGRAAIAKTVDASKIDSTMTELKLKLSSYWVNPNNLIAVENKGYCYRE